MQKLQKRITLSNDKQKQKKDFISFLKQKIGEEKKEEEKKDSPKGGKPAEEGGCPCCDCWGKKKGKKEKHRSDRSLERTTKRKRRGKHNKVTKR